MMFYFYKKNVEEFLGLLEGQVKIKKDPFMIYLKGHQPFQWVDKFMSNYEYLQWLNEIAGRNYNDITQYPVLPWVFVSDNSPEEEKAFRDLAKNMGSQGEEDRINRFL